MLEQKYHSFKTHETRTDYEYSCSRKIHKLWNLCALSLHCESTDQNLAVTCAQISSI